MIRLPKWLLMTLAVVGLVGGASLARADHVSWGKLKTVTADKNQIVVTDDKGKDWTFHIAEGAKICHPDKDNDKVLKEGKLGDLRVGTPLSILWDEKGDRMMAKAVLACEGVYRDAALGRGTLKSATGDQVVITDPKGKEWTYRVADQARVRVNDRVVQMNDLKAGDNVVFVYEKQGDRHLLRDICAERK